MANNNINDIPLQYVCLIQHYQIYDSPENRTNIKFNKQGWDTYKLYNKSFIFDFIITHVIEVFNNFTEIFTEDHLQHYFNYINSDYFYSKSASYLPTNLSITYSINEILLKHYVNIKFCEDEVNPNNNGYYRQLYGTGTVNISRMYILHYLLFHRAIDRMMNSVYMIELTFEKYKKMFNFYFANGACQTVFESDQFSIKSNTLFIKVHAIGIVNMKYMNEVVKELSNANNDAEDFEIFKRCDLDVERHDIACEYLHNEYIYWEDVGNNTVNIYSLFQLINYYTSENKIIKLTSTSCRTTVMPFLIVPNKKRLLLIDDLKRNPYCVPIIKTINVSIKHAISTIKTLFSTVPCIMRKNVCFYECFCKNPMFKHNIVDIDIVVPTESDIINLFNDEHDVSRSIKSKKSKKNSKKSKNKNASKSIDISSTSENEIIELPVIDNQVNDIEYILSDNAEREIIEDSDDTDSIGEPENINISLPVDTVVKYTKLPFSIIFYKYEYITFNDRDMITHMLTELYTNNEKFREFMLDYNTIRVIQSFHRDFNKLDKSIHFNCIFYDTTTVYKSPVYHAYISGNNEIISLTTITNVLK